MEGDGFGQGFIIQPALGEQDAAQRLPPAGMLLRQRLLQPLRFHRLPGGQQLTELLAGLHQLCRIGKSCMVLSQTMRLPTAGRPGTPSMRGRWP